MMQEYFDEMTANKPRWYVLKLSKIIYNDNMRRFYEWSSNFERAYTPKVVVYESNALKTIEWNVNAIDSTRKNDAVYVIFERNDSTPLKPLILEK
ncbi:MAG: hypothetical protein HC817_01780 [Saprospiraceae bacterium]|nr:hypothetical protein [Saprospiraceae bacterium]